MTTDLDAELREAMLRLADEPAPTGLVEAAMRRGRRQRRTHTVLGIAAALVVGAAAPAVVLNVFAGSAPTVTPPVLVEGTPVRIEGTPSSRVLVPGGWTRPPLVVVAYGGGPGADASAILDPETGEYIAYVEYSYWPPAPSPDGTQMIVYGGTGAPDDPLRTGVFDVQTRTVRWIDGLTGWGSWSPDGKEILLINRNQPEGTGFAIVDVATLTGTYVPFPVFGFDLVWTPDGDQLGLSVPPDVIDPDDPHRLAAVNFYDRTGQFVRSLPADAALHAPTDFSPDGTSVVLYNVFSKTVKVADATSGAVLHEIALTDHVVDCLGWIDDAHLLLQLTPDRYQPNHLAIVDLAGAVVEIVELPEELRMVETLRVRPAEGLAPAAAQHAF